MGFADSGAVRAMQTALRNNRELLKKTRKTAGELAQSHPARGNGTLGTMVSDPKRCWP